MALTTQVLVEGAVSLGQILKFDVEETGSVVISDLNLDDTPVACDLMILRRTFTGADSDYVVMTPVIPLNNANNYQVLGPGRYAVKVTTAAPMIITVTK